MPIPAMLPKASLTAASLPEPILVRHAPLPRRGLAHGVDFCVVAGAASYFSSLFSVLVLSAHAETIGTLGNGSEAAFLDAAELAGAQLFAGTFVFSSVFFFVAVPLVAGKTLGMGLLGLRLRAEGDGALTPRPLLRRLAAYWINYLAGGIPNAFSLLRGKGHLFQDHMSGTSVVVDE